MHNLGPWITVTRLEPTSNLLQLISKNNEIILMIWTALRPKSAKLGDLLDVRRLQQQSLLRFQRKCGQTHLLYMFSFHSYHGIWFPSRSSNARKKTRILNILKLIAPEKLVRCKRRILSPCMPKNITTFATVTTSFINNELKLFWPKFVKYEAPRQFARRPNWFTNREEYPPGYRSGSSLAGFWYFEQIDICSIFRNQGLADGSLVRFSILFSSNFDVQVTTSGLVSLKNCTCPTGPFTQQ